MAAKVGYIDLTPKGLVASFVSAMVGLFAGMYALFLTNKLLGNTNA